HAQEVIVKCSRLAAHRVGQALAPPHRKLESPNHRPKSRPFVLSPKALHRRVQIDPSVEIAGELSAEVYQVLEGDSAEAPLVPPRPPDCGWRLSRRPRGYLSLLVVREHLVHRFRGWTLVDAHPDGPSRGAGGRPRRRLCLALSGFQSPDDLMSCERR